MDDDFKIQKRAEFFIYAPPLRGRRRKNGGLMSKRRLPNPPFRGAEPWQCSVYYYWWEYLRRHEGYRATCMNAGIGEHAALYQDFGDVHANDDFWAWWREHTRLFSEPPTRGIQECMLNTPFANDQLILSVPLEVRSVNLVRMFRRILKENTDRVKIARSASRAKYPVAIKPNLAALHTSLTIWDLKKENPNLKLYEIFDLAAAKTSIAVDERVTISGDDDDKPFIITLARAERDAKKSGIEDVLLREVRKVVRRRKAQTVNRHINTACAYIENAAKGKFPLK